MSNSESNLKSSELIISEEDNSRELTIDTDSDGEKQRSRSPTKKKRRLNNEDLIDINTEKFLRSVAKKNCLSDESVRNILRKLVKNDHILAIVKIKEEEELRMEKNEEHLDETEGVKITRQKAKELNYTILPLKSSKEPCPDITTLVQGELQPDEEDEEYTPCEDDFIPSDDDTNTTISDLDSQPRTPATPYPLNEIDENSRTPKYSNDGVFKIPILVESVELTEEQEIIAKRTRSKVCLHETPIETIEATFIPPDITTDNYNFEIEPDNEWMQFLTMPLDTNENDDVENDPEFVAPADEPVMFDKEELKDTKVSKKEFEDLMKDIQEILAPLDFNELGDIYSPAELDAHKPPKCSPRYKKKRSTAEATVTSGATTTSWPSENSPNLLNFNPNIMSSPNSSTAAHSSKPTVSSDLNTPYKEIQTEVSTENRTIALEVTTSSSTTKITDTSSNIIFLNTTPTVMSTSQSISTENMTTTIAVDASSAISNVVDTSFVLNTTPTIMSTSQSILPSTPIILTDGANNIVQISNLGGLIYQNGVYRLADTSQFVIQTPSTEPNDIRVVNMSLAPPVVNLTDDCKTTHKIFPTKVKMLDQRYEYLNTLSPTTAENNTNDVGFTAEQRQLLDQQLRMHVQLATQCFLQTYGHPSFWTSADEFMEFLKTFSDKNDGSKEGSVYNILNLNDALECCASWQKRLEEDSKENQEYLEYLNADIAKCKEYYAGPRKPIKSLQLSKIPPKLGDHIVMSKAFIYPALLPEGAFRASTYSKNSTYSPSEDYLIAMGLEKHYKELEFELRNSRKDVGLNAVCQRLSENICVSHSSASLYHYVRKKIKQSSMNPIQYYSKNKVAPPIKWEYKEQDLTNIRAPIDLTFKELDNLVWEKFIKRDRTYFKYARKLTAEEIQQDLLTPKVKRGCSNIKKSSPKGAIKQKKISTPASNIQIHYNPSENNHPGDTSYTITEKTTKVTSSTSTTVIIEQNINHSSFLRTELSDDLGSESFSNPSSHTTHRSTSPCICCVHPKEEDIDSSIVECNQKLLTDFFTVKRKISPEKVYTKIAKIILDFHSNYDELLLKELQENPTLLAVYNYFKSFDIFLSLLVDIKMNQNVQNTAVPDSVENAALTVPLPNKLKRSFAVDSVKQEKDKDLIFAQNFYEKVRETFIGENSAKDFEAFQTLLVNFDYECESVPDLYYKMEKLFYPRHPELAETFLTFLMPGHAAQVGKFLEHYMLTNMSSFINKLNLYYSRQPAQMRKIFACLNELSSDKTVTMQTIRTKVLPLLKGCQVLIDWFLQMFPDETPSESPVSSYEQLHVSKHHHDFELTDSQDSYERIPPTEMAFDSENACCGVKYLHGRVFYGTRVLLPARLSFLAYDNMKSSEIDENLVMNEDNVMECVHNTTELEKSHSEMHAERSVVKVELNNSLPQLCGDGNQPVAAGSKETVYTLSNKIKDQPIEDSAYTLCDNYQLRTHALRLNPIVHGNASDNEVLDTKDDSSDSSLKGSPKRQNLNLQSHPPSKLPLRKTLSPNVKKNTKSPDTSSCSKLMDAIPSTSAALATAKKLKIMIEEDSSNDDRPLSERLKKCQAVKILQSGSKASQNPELDDSESDGSRFEGKKSRKRLKKRMNSKKVLQDINNVSSQKKIKSKDFDLDVQHKVTEPVASCSTTSYPITIDDKVPKIEPKIEFETQPQTQVVESWTRDEDKIILEAVSLGFSDEVQLINQIETKLPRRAHGDIILRYQFLLNILRQLQSQS